MLSQARKGFIVHFFYYTAWSLFYPILSLALSEYKHMTESRASFFVSSIVIVTLVLGPSITASSHAQDVQLFRHRLGILCTATGLIVIMAVPDTLAGFGCFAIGLGKAHLDGPLRLTLMSDCPPSLVSKRIFGRQVSFYLAYLTGASFLYVTQNLMTNIVIATSLLLVLLVFCGVGRRSTRLPSAKLELKHPPVRFVLDTYPSITLVLVSGVFFTAGLGAHQAIGLNAFISVLGKTQGFFILGASAACAVFGTLISLVVKVSQRATVFAGAAGSFFGFGLMATGSSWGLPGICVAGCSLVSFSEVLVLSSMESYVVSLNKNDDLSGLVGVADLRYLGFGLGPPLGALLLSYGSRWFFLGCGFVSIVGCVAQALCVYAHPTACGASQQSFSKKSPSQVF